MPQKGRFGHAAVVARGNLMLVVGGYSGQVLDDLILYRVPSAVATQQVMHYDRGADNHSPTRQMRVEFRIGEIVKLTTHQMRVEF
jgi:hypothetical protein